MKRHMCALQGAGFQEGLRCVYVNGTAVPPRWLGFDATIQNSGTAGVSTGTPYVHVAVFGVLLVVEK